MDPARLAVVLSRGDNLVNSLVNFCSRVPPEVAGSDEFSTASQSLRRPDP